MFFSKGAPERLPDLGKSRNAIWQAVARVYRTPAWAGTNFPCSRILVLSIQAKGGHYAGSKACGQFSAENGL